MRVSLSSFRYLANNMLNCTAVVAEATKISRYHALFGSSPDVISEAWYRMDVDALQRSANPFHLLWAHIFLKVYGNESVHAAISGVDEDTFQKWSWRMIDAFSLFVTRLVS